MKEKYKIKFINIFKHLHVVNKHRFKVFCLCCRVGIPIQGLLHDLSKYSPIEFWESVKYFQGTYSPIRNCKKENGYSRAWLHHKGRNKHHCEYWYDYDAPNETPVIPFKYVLEMTCDTLAAGMTYQGKNWTKHHQLQYWNKVKDTTKINKKIYNFFEIIYKEIDKKGLETVLKRKYLKEVYDECTK